MVPLPILVPAPDRTGDFPVGGRLVFRPATLSRGLGEELRLLELLVDRDRTFDPLARELLLPLTCPSALIVVAKTPGESWEAYVDVEVDAGTPSLGTDLLDLLLPSKVAPLFSLNSSGLFPAKV